MPHVVATALINQLTDDPDRNIAAALAAGSWRDMTRVALTDPDRTRAMVEEDADNVERLLRMMAARLTEVADELHGADAGAIAAFFADGQPFRDYKSAVRSGADGDGPVFDLTIPAEGWQAALLDSARRGEHILRFGDDYTACVQRRSGTTAQGRVKWRSGTGLRVMMVSASMVTRCSGRDPLAAASRIISNV